MNLATVFSESAKKDPEKTAVYNEGDSISYVELETLVNKMSCIFADNGVAYRDHVGVLLHNEITFIVAMLACANLGAAMVPLSPVLPVPSMLRSFSAADVKHVVGAKSFFEDGAASPKHFPGMRLCADGKADGALSLPELYAKADSTFIVPYEVYGDEPYILTMTSGSTGNPKPIVLTQKNKYDRAMAAIGLYGVTSDDRVLAATPLYHSLAERLVLIPLLIGGTSILMSRYTAELWLKQVKERSVTFTIAVSSQLAQIAELLSSPFSPEISSLRCLVSSSALLEPHIKTELLAKLNCEIHECYGTSEVAIATNLNMADAGKSLHSVGKAIPNVEVRVMRENGTCADAMEIGEIQCKTPMLFGGYYKQPENTAASMQDGFFRTGDLGYVDGEGYLYYSGRSKDIIITGAVNVYPIDIEEAAAKLDTVAECAAFSLPDDRLGELVALAVVPKNKTDFNLRSLKHHCARYLSDYQIPRKYFVIDELPKNAMGKVMKRKLVEALSEPQNIAVKRTTARRPLKIGFVGGGISSAIGYAHAAACGMDRLFVIESGSFSRNEETNFDSAEIYNVGKENVYSAWSDMLAQKGNGLDAIAVLLPIPDHFSLVKAALESKIPVICEKPLVTSSQQARILRDTCEDNGGFLAITYNYTGYPMVRELRQIIRDGKLGKILHFQAEMPQESYVRDSTAPQNWRLQENSPSFLTLDLLTHLHHMIEYLLGERPTAVAAAENSFGRFDGIADDCRCVAEYSNSISGSFWVSKSALGFRNGMRISIFGSAGSAVWVQEAPEQITLSFSDGNVQKLDRGSALKEANLPQYTRFKAGHPSGYIEAFANLYRDIWDALHSHLTGNKAQSGEIATLSDEIGRMRFLEAVSASSKSRKWEMINYDA